MLIWRHNSNYETVYYQESQVSVDEKLGQPVESFECNPDSPEEYGAFDAFCRQESVATVSKYQICYLPVVCDDMITVAYDKTAKMVYKYRGL